MTQSLTTSTDNRKDIEMIDWKPISEHPRDGRDAIFITEKGHVVKGWWAADAFRTFADWNRLGSPIIEIRPLAYVEYRSPDFVLEAFQRLADEAMAKPSVSEKAA